ncbi:DHH family phosphoesterase [Candidatus Phytoplasma solani]|uniref:Exopolyphosphatase-related protein n=1 Tax=Candidatus Phytoplasma solani TaxID=69896 RepID=A0A421NXJ2_9MOLU|nr:bifunctional oligoribonuclease/PAP phosphatase NrnA [Candidatus Phytoplasma solani]RMI88726.1 exopolyphosphatase-related protein [Candidatus Phytoplasma solani]
MKLIQEKIQAFDTIIIHGHIKPDGDSYGAQFGLKNMLTNTFPHKHIYAVGESNPNFPFLGTMDQISDDLYQNALVIVVDSGDTKVISDQRYALGKFVIRIDHHILTENYGNYEWVDDSFGSCSEMIYLLKEQLNLKLTFQGALAIYIGMVTDSGNFRFHRVSSQTFRIAAELINYGIDITLVEQNIKKEKLHVLKYKGYVYQNIVVAKNFVYVYVSQKTIAHFNLTLEEAFSAVHLLSHLENYLFYILFLEQPNHKIKVRLCSNGPNIYDIVKKYGCKGHLRACSLFLASEVDIKPFVKTLEKEIVLFLQKP